MGATAGCKRYDRRPKFGSSLRLIYLELFTQPGSARSWEYVEHLEVFSGQFLEVTNYFYIVLSSYNGALLSSLTLVIPNPRTTFISLNHNNSVAQ